MPPFWKHCAFMLSDPYKAWYLIKDGKTKMGVTYLTDQNEIGIFIQHRFQRLGIGLVAIHKLMEAHPTDKYLANIAPKNTASQEFFTRLGFKLIQFTYAKEHK